ncbi:MAG: Hsp20/alpha crystallin family protein [Ferruginibacter sp.]
MKEDILYDTDCLVYPGVYVPLLREEEVLSALKRTHECEMFLPPVNVTELADSFKVEMAIPGVRREDFVIQADENILSICAVHKECELHEGESFQLHEFNYDCIDRHIVLPDNSDPEFISAEYQAGILRIYVPKTKQPARNLHTRIAVY